MMKKILLGLFVVASFQLCAQSNESPIKVEWLQPEKYSDIRPANEPKGSYRRHVLASFDKFWQKMSARLPQGYNVKLTMKDVDLAGDVNPLYRLDNREIRVIKEIYFPRITLDYQVLDANNQVVLEGKDVKIKDMNFMNTTGLRYSSQEFGHEKAMLDKWFTATVLAKTGTVQDPSQ